MKKVIIKFLVTILVCMSIGKTLYVSAAEEYNVEETSSKEITFEQIEIDENNGGVSTMSTSSSSGGSTYYYNTGTKCPSQANYSKYNLVMKLRKGDIIYESKGGYGLTGHAAIVEGIFFDMSNGKYYVRVIEADSTYGVIRSIFDATRYDEWGGVVYRVSEATDDEKGKAVKFCIGELGAAYKLEPIIHSASGQPNWYCSELVWAGYNSAGINLVGIVRETNWYITPRDITVYSDDTIKIAIN